jgi:hypothetical protein
VLRAMHARVLYWHVGVGGSGRKLPFEVAALVVANEPMQRVLVHFLQNITQLLFLAGIAGKAGAINVSQRANESIAVLSADFTIPIAMPLIESWLVQFKTPN